ncbi:type I 3-dehydroquinate dehydratase [uncultured Methanosphaera sp.]|uniref:type I 3-dehydroquinate dehydratase n=1 Tax=uncultured Methanosphaera sp. TaxID=262501 RepID=UPI0025DBFA21|nr:type I 3-dehydroquinate dehydratase [uncultured Methanosphaera sp.]
MVEENEEDILNTLQKAIDSNVDYVELRADVINDVTSAKVSYIIDKMKSISDIPIILTNRTGTEGGFFQGSEEERIKILSDNACFVEYIDVELSTDNTLRQKVIDNANKTIISYHNFNETPSFEYLEDIVIKAKNIGDIPKVAVKPQKLEDTFILLKLMMKYRNMIGISMDKIGAYTRVIGPIIGAPITYAAIDSHSAPGQLDIKTTDEIIRKLKY